MSDRFIEYNPVPECELNGKLESEARQLWCSFTRVIRGEGSGAAGGNVTINAMPSFNRVSYAAPSGIVSTPTGANCLASACAHWRWLHKGGTRYEKQSFQSEHPVPDGMAAPADVPDGWTFMRWDGNVTALKKNGGNPATPRFWASRATEIILPRGLCGLAGEE